MIKVEHLQVDGWGAAIRGMRNPMNSWDKSDSEFDEYRFYVGKNDLALIKKLCSAGTEHRKFLRQVFVSMDITAPLYWWKEFDTYKVGVTANSCSTMHKIAAKEFTFDDFSVEHLITRADCDENDNYDNCTLFMDDMFKDVSPDMMDDLELRQDVSVILTPIEFMKGLIILLNIARNNFILTHDKKFWWQMIQLLPTSYNQRRTVTMNYENVLTIIRQRTGHKLDEWNQYIDILKGLPYVKELMEEK